MSSALGLAGFYTHHVVAEILYRLIIFLHHLDPSNRQFLPEQDRINL